MADVYSSRLLGRLIGLANLLSKNGYQKESSNIRNLIGKVQAWKNDEEWNDTNAMTIGDADYVLEETVKTFTNTINEIARKKLVEKRKQETEKATSSTDEIQSALKEIEKAMAGI